MHDCLNKHILVVEDSKDLQSLFKTLLESEGYSVDCTSNGSEALRLLRENERLPQLILLDMRMPVMDGMEFRRVQNSDAALKNIPVVFLSGERDIESVGAPVLKKPLDISCLLEAVRTNCSLH